MEHSSRKAIVAAAMANLAIAVAKLIGFVFTGAASMLAEAVHSFADTTNQGLLFLGGSRARRAASPEHPFGYGRERYFWAFIVALVIFSAGSMFALFEGVEKLRAPHKLDSAGWAVGILLASMVMEGLSFRTAVREARHTKGSESWWGYIRRTKSPELPVVLLEDLGALIGLALALLGVVLAELTGNARFDALGSVAIAVLLAVIAVTLVVEMKSLLIGESASPAVVARICKIMESSDKVVSVIHLRTEHLGPDELLVGAKVAFDTSLDVFRLAQAIDDLEANVRSTVPEARVIYIEPDICKPVDEEGHLLPAPSPA